MPMLGVMWLGIRGRGEVAPSPPKETSTMYFVGVLGRVTRLTTWYLRGNVSFLRRGGKRFDYALRIRYCKS